MYLTHNIIDPTRVPAVSYTTWGGSSVITSMVELGHLTCWGVIGLNSRFSGTERNGISTVIWDRERRNSSVNSATKRNSTVNRRIKQDSTVQ